MRPSQSNLADSSFRRGAQPVPRQRGNEASNEDRHQRLDEPALSQLRRVWSGRRVERRQRRQEVSPCGSSGNGGEARMDK
eukprot:scaffold31086_cov27-Tisochrysis_lutea.AAC.4